VPIVLERTDMDRIFVAAYALDVSLPTVDRLIKAGRIETAKVGKRILIRKSSLERLTEARPETAFPDTVAARRRVADSDRVEGLETFSTKVHRKV